MKKVLIIRFSSIGDIVLTSPIVRCIKKQLNCEVHFLTKTSFAKVVEANPYIDNIVYLKKNIGETISEIQNLGFDIILDLHNNLRSNRITFFCAAKVFRFDKLNILKWMAVHPKINKLDPSLHIVDRYFKAIESLNVTYDNQGLDYFIDNEDNLDIKITTGFDVEGYTALVLGATYFTKRIPLNKWQEIIENSSSMFVLLGAKEENQLAEILLLKYGDRIHNFCGKLNLNQSASVVKQAKIVITGDTGLMHIAAAYRKSIISVWGNTIPAFGMFPFFPSNYSEKSIALEVKGLECRPCSKLGFDSCPKGHFECMQKIDTTVITNFLQK